MRHRLSRRPVGIGGAVGPLSASAAAAGTGTPHPAAAKAGGALPPTAAVLALGGGSDLAGMGGVGLSGKLAGTVGTVGGEGGPMAVPKDEPIVLRRFADEERGGGGGGGVAVAVPVVSSISNARPVQTQVAAVAAEVAAAPNSVATGATSMSPQQRPSRPRSDSGALALLNLASHSPAAVPASPSEGQKQQQRRQGVPSERSNEVRSTTRGGLDGAGRGGWHGGPDLLAYPPPSVDAPNDLLAGEVRDAFGRAGAFRHVADYAAGMALRDLVLGPVLYEFDESKTVSKEGKGGGREEEAEMRKSGLSSIRTERLAEDVMDRFVTGRVLVEEEVDAPSQSSNLSPKEAASGAGAPPSTSVVLRMATIRPVVSSDVPEIESWYETGGDKVLPYTGPEWSEWWVDRCRLAEEGCAMVKLCANVPVGRRRKERGKDQNERGGEAEEREGERCMDLQQQHEEEEVILGLAYYERNVVDEFPVFDDIDEDDVMEAKTVKDASTNTAATESKVEVASTEVASEEGQRRQPEQEEKEVQGALKQNGEKKESESQQRQVGPSRRRRCRTVRTTLLRGIRLNPSINPEVARRSSLRDDRGNGIDNRNVVERGGELRLPQYRYRGIQATLLLHVLSQSLSCGTTSFGVNSIKHDDAEEFYSLMLGEGPGRNRPVCIRNDNGRRYYRVTDDGRWDLLRACLGWQMRLWRNWKSTDSTSESGVESSRTEVQAAADTENNILDQAGVDAMEIDASMTEPLTAASGVAKPSDQTRRRRRDVPADVEGGEKGIGDDHATGKGGPPSKRLRTEDDLRQINPDPPSTAATAAPINDGAGNNCGHLSSVTADTSNKNDAQKRDDGKKNTEGKESEQTSPSGGGSSSGKAMVPVCS